MTPKQEHEQLIRQALALLGSDDDNTRRQVEWAMRSVERQRTWKQSGLYGTQTSDQKVAAKQLALALRKLQDRLNDRDLTQEEFRHFPLHKYDFARWIARAEAAATKPLLSRRDPIDVAKRCAVREALKLLTARGLKVSLTRGGPFLQLAAIIYGEPDADLMNYARSLIVGPKKDRE